MKKIKVPFPIYEGLEVKNVTADIENGYSIVEYGEKEKKCEFKRGDILYRDFCTLIYRGTNESGGVLTDVFLENKSLDIIFRNVGSGCGYTEWFNLATNSQKQILFDALAKEGKYWDAEALEVKDFIKVPESIGIYRSKEDFGIDGDGLYIAFNNNKQLLYYNSKYNVWSVCPLHNGYKKVQCYLQPCKIEDLKSGDTAFFSPTFRLSEDITSDLGRYVKIVGKANYKTNKSGEIVQERNFAEWWYKLIPING